MPALCLPPPVRSADEAGVSKWWFINPAPNLNISNLLSILKPSPAPEEINPRTVSGHGRRRDTQSTALPPPQAVKSSSLQKQPREAAAHDRESSCGDDGNNGNGGGGRLNKGYYPQSQGGEMNRYWIPNFDIDKRVITLEIQYYLGPGSTVRSYTFEGEDGFLISTLGECLTDEQIDDICRKSKELRERKAVRRNMSSEYARQLKRPLHQPVIVARSLPRCIPSRDRERGRKRTRRRLQYSSSEGRNSTNVI